MKKRFAEEQIIGAIKEAEGGEKVVDVCRYDIADATCGATRDNS